MLDTNTGITTYAHRIQIVGGIDVGFFTCNGLIILRLDKQYGKCSWIGSRLRYEQHAGKKKKENCSFHVIIFFSAAKVVIYCDIRKFIY